MMQSASVFFHIVLIGLLVASATSAPVLPNEVDSDNAKDDGGKKKDDYDLGLSYERYLKQIIEYLEEDERFRDKLGSAKLEDITSGKIANELQFVNRNIRSRLDELKRKEIQRLRKAAKQENELAHGIDRRRMGMPLHVDVHNPHTFEIEDLRKLVVQTTKDLEDIDRKRREEFKQYEMEKEHKRREELQHMDESRRKQAEKEHEEQLKRHREHPRLHHPGSKPQLEEVWEKEDRLPTEEFDPLTFFQMHDLDGDGHWDEEEIESLFRQELNKMYDQNNTDDDMLERREEMDRMREHVVNETDTNHDGMISVQEFLEMTKRNEFGQDPGWEGLDEQELYDENEFQEFQRQHQAGMIPPGAVYVPGGIPEGVPYQQIADGQPQQMYPSHVGYNQVPPGSPQYQYQQQVPQYQGGVPPGQYQYHQPVVPQGYQGGQQNFQGYQPQMQHQGMPPQYQGVPVQNQQQQPQYQGVPVQNQQQQPHQGTPQQGGQQPPNQGMPVQGGQQQPAQSGQQQPPPQGVPVQGGQQQQPTQSGQQQQSLPASVVQGEQKIVSEQKTSDQSQTNKAQTEIPKSQ